MGEVKAKVELRHEAPRKTVVEVVIRPPQNGPATIHLQGEEHESWTSTSHSFVITERLETR